MRGVVQRVMRASVSVEGEVVGAIGRGLCVLVGISRDDTDKDMEYLVRKILNLRFFDDETSGKRWNKSVADLNLEVLCVSQVVFARLNLALHFGMVFQFTLHSVLKGNKLDFHKSMGSDKAPEFYGRFLEKLKSSYRADLVKDGKFGEYMQVDIQNDGPVTIILDSQKDDSSSASTSKDS